MRGRVGTGCLGVAVFVWGACDRATLLPVAVYWLEYCYHKNQPSDFLLS